MRDQSPQAPLSLLQCRFSGSWVWPWCLLFYGTLHSGFPRLLPAELMFKHVVLLFFTLCFICIPKVSQRPGSPCVGHLVHPADPQVMDGWMHVLVHNWVTLMMWQDWCDWVCTRGSGLGWEGKHCSMTRNPCEGFLTRSFQVGAEAGELGSRWCYCLW